ncbi:MAG: tetratricopeptide repeat protein [Deltaproteobacteria bacterium]|nr:tetratricopeptide repeat protein [Deltaproteobacteria bacterium]
MRIRTLVCGALLVPMLALAQPKSADDWYKEGETQYNLGNFDKAADAFKQGFALETTESKKASYLYNVAQAYRQEGKCRDALFFYKRYLALKDADTAKPLSAEKREQTERLIAEQEECVKKLDSNAQTPPGNTLPPDGAGSGSATPVVVPTGGGAGSGGKVVAQGGGGGEEGSDGEEEPTTPTNLTPPKLLNVRLDGGAAKISAGTELTIPMQASFSLVAGYPVFVQNQLEIDAGLALGFTPLPWQNTMTMEKKQGNFISALADVGATYFVAPRIGLRADVGVGVQALGGISDAGNPFTDMGAPTSGALATFAVRAAASADYLVTNNVFATIMPIAFTYSPAKEGLRPDIKSITRLDFMVGVGYRM